MHCPRITDITCTCGSELFRTSSGANISPLERWLWWSCQEAHNSHARSRACRPWYHPISIRSTHIYVSNDLTSISVALLDSPLHVRIYPTGFLYFSILCLHVVNRAWDDRSNGSPSVSALQQSSFYIRFPSTNLISTSFRIQTSPSISPPSHHTHNHCSLISLRDTRCIA